MNEPPCTIISDEASAMDQAPPNTPTPDYSQSHFYSISDSKQEDGSVVVSSINTSPLLKSQERSKERVDRYADAPSPVRNATLFDKPFYSTSYSNSPWKTAYTTEQNLSMRYKANISAAYASPCARQQVASEEGDISSSFRDPKGWSGGYYHRRKNAASWGSPYPEVPPYIATTSPAGFYDFSNDIRSPPARHDIEYQPQFHQTADPIPYHANPYQAPRVLNKRECEAPASASRVRHPYTTMRLHEASADDTVSHAVTFSPNSQQGENKTYQYHSSPSSSELSSSSSSPPWRPRYGKNMNKRAKVALDTWYARLRDLYEYKAKHGDCLVPQKYSENPALGIYLFSCFRWSISFFKTEKSLP